MIRIFIVGYLFAGALAVHKRTCVHNSKVYREGDRFMDGCKICFCKRTTVVACTNIMCRPKWKQYQVQMKASEGTCQFKGKIYKQRDRFVNGCQLCFCGPNSVVGCTTTFIMCKAVADREVSPEYFPKPSKKENKGKGCTLRGKMYMPGAYFINGCNQCFCGFNGYIGCTQKMCAGRKYRINKETCEHKNRLYKKGDRFMDECNQCMCGGNDIVGCTKHIC